jgi:DNA-binding NtrC family response regulator
MAKIKILYIDEEQNNLNAFNAYFRRQEAFSVKCSPSIKEAANHLEQYIHVLIIDHAILEEVGLNFCQNPSLEKTIIIAVTARQSFEILDLAVDQGIIFKYHCKPYDLDTISKSIEEAIECSNT